ncbi:MAG: ParB/RepB/Spo0J family partition protein [Gemella haemolysans]|jgi:nucleoid occlusion protein|uniref:Putative nucleoid occlusion protein n=1 Tax=Gemella haemolysans TaxID=1379 RepID=A0A134A105_9BACL|nr:ParB/RepB/Spo0J family partition protein [Gemella haemolysans]KXB61363.1 putative nucleoid occlusion protein [Gemella haemolysans]MBS5318554.1 ParB/RepB/Spo0J family partition protein [Gemella haemolysans]MDU3831796.1 ParB/RepB/Spo0J family partition protein [Gemella haemolysans]TKW63161.1 MAG: ParB/RepB/Spo0J family partition protein [Gemella sp.]
MTESVKPFSKLYDLTQRAEKVGISDDDVLREILVEKIVPNKYQPRREFTEEKIKELAESIKQNGLLQSITVRDIGDGFYELIAGERRLRAIKYLQYPKTKAIVKELTDEQMATLALIENIQREELTPIEEAHAYQELLRINKLTQDELAKSLGKTQATVANKLRLLKLSKKVIDAINTKKITERHGRAMVKLDSSAQEKLLIQILSQNLNVSQTEEKIDTYLKIKKDTKVFNPTVNYDGQKIISKLIKEIAKLEEKYNINLNKEEEETMESVVIKVTVPRFVKKEVNDENISDM